MILQLRNLVLLAVFSIAMSFGARAFTVTVATPNGGGIYSYGTNLTVTWSADFVAAGYAKSIVLLKNGALEETIYTGTGEEDRTLTWIIPVTAEQGADYKVEVTENLIFDQSDTDFRITAPVVVTSPNTGVIWENLSNTHTITWTGGTGTAEIRLFKGGVDLGVINGAATSPYSWTISTPLSDSDYKIQVTDALDGSTDQSNTNFTILQTIHVTVPTTPGISWNLGSLNTITWTDNVPGPVKVDLYIDNTLHEVLSASVPDGTNSFAWTIPNNHAMGNHFRVKVSSIAQPTTVVDFSDFRFRIDAATNTYDITVLQPSDAGIHWTSGEDYLISWTDNINSPVKIDLINYTLNDSTIIATGIVGSTYSWHIPDGTPNGTQYRILVTSTTENGVQGLSSNYFEISDTPYQANMVVEQPSVNGIEWLRGTSHLISWTDNIPLNDVVIELYIDDNLNDVLDAGDDFVATVNAAASGSTYTWTIPDVPATYPDDMYLMKIYYNDAVDVSNFAFSISDHTTTDVIDVLQPDVAGIHWYRGQPYLISWIDNVPGSVDVVYYRTDEGTEYPIVSDFNSGTTTVFTFPVNDGTTPESTHYKVKVYSHSDHVVVSASANEFSLTDYTYGGTITVLQPNGGETLTKGTVYLISWDDNILENVQIDLVNDATATTTLIASNVLSSAYYWTIPTNATVPAGILYKVKITSMETGTITDLSNAYFTIVEPALNAVVYPNPATDMVNIQVNNPTEEQYTVTFTNRFNMEVLNRSYSNSQELHISTVGIPSGIYFVTVASKSAVTTHKVIIQH